MGGRQCCLFGDDEEDAPMLRPRHIVAARSMAANLLFAIGEAPGGTAGAKIGRAERLVERAGALLDESTPLVAASMARLAGSAEARAREARVLITQVLAPEGLIRRATTVCHQATNVADLDTCSPTRSSQARARGQTT
jgi:hypothetical protein